MGKKCMLILLGILLILSDYSILLAVPTQNDNLFSPQEIERCEKINSKAMVAFKKKEYELLYGYFFQPPYYDAHDIKNVREYFVAIAKMIGEEIGELEDYSPVPLNDIPEDGWICYGENMFFHTFDLKSYHGLYLKTYKAIFSKIKSFPVYICVWTYLGIDQYLIRDFGVALPASLAFEDNYGEINLNRIERIDMERIKRLEKRISFLKTGVYDQCCETKGKGCKVKVFADTPPDKGDRVTYILPTQEGELLTFCVDYCDYSEDAEIETANITPPSELQNGEQIYTFLTKENEPLKIKYWFLNGEIADVNLELDSLKKEKTGKKEIFVESQGGFLIRFNLEWEDGKFIRTHCQPKVHPFSAGGLHPFPSAEEIANERVGYERN